VTRRILLVGDAMLDVVVRPLAPVAPTSDTSANVRVARGGSAANLAVAMRAVVDGSFEVSFAGVVGNDAGGRLVREDLELSGVVAHLNEVSGATGVVVALVGEHGERAMMTERGVNSELRYDHVAPWLDPSLIHLHISGYTILDPRTRGMVSRLLERAGALGATTSIDVCSVEPLRHVGVEHFTRSARGATMIFANEEEALALAGASDVHAALTSLAGTWSEVVVTRGAKGALARHEGRNYSAHVHVEDVVDTTGAGDSATGTYLGDRLNGRDVQSALGHAMAAAAQVVKRLGSSGAREGS
jgi:sugar/nucleoside kinase (ribokinase family)